jgi:hypothetical protein
MNNNKVTLICGSGGSGKTRLAHTKAAELGEYSIFYWDAMPKNMAFFNRRTSNADVAIIEGLTFSGIATHTEFLKELMDEAETYLIFTMLTVDPLHPSLISAEWRRIDQVIDLSVAPEGVIRP